MISTKEIENYKDFESQLKIINLINSWDNSNVSLSKDNKFSTNGKITKQKKKIQIKINDINFPNFDRFEKINDVEATIEEFECLFDSFYRYSTYTEVSKINLEKTNICSLNIIKNRFFNIEKSKYQCFISTEVSKLNTFFLHCETVTCQDKKNDHFYDCLRITLDNFLFDIIQVKNEGKGFYVIDCLQEVEFEGFCNYCFSIKQALGFITTHMPGGEEIIFSDKQGFYYCNNLRPQIDSIYCPINCNPYSRLSDQQEIAEKYRNKLTKLKLEEFSNLVSAIHNNQELSASIILLLEGSSIRSFIIIPSVFSVVLESLSRIISQDEQGIEYPIDNRNIADSLIKDLTKLVDSYSNKISSKGILKIKRRIDEINKPINKKYLTNTAKLTLPYKQLGVELSIDDIKAIEHRNDLLHGDILMIRKGLKSESDISNHMAYISGKLFTLISALILKYVGYDGYIINHAKIHEDSCKVKTDEEYFRLIKAFST